MRPPPVVVFPDNLTPEQFAKKRGVSKKRFRELQIIAEKAFNEAASEKAAEMGVTVEEFLDSLRRTPDPKAAARKSGPAISAAVKAKLKPKVASSARKPKASKPN